MKKFRYTAVDNAGKASAGRLEAASADEVYEKIKADGLFCTGVEEISSGLAAKSGYRMRLKDISLFCRQMGAMLSAGLTIVKALDILYNKATNPKVKKVLLSLYEGIQKGLSFYEAMRDQENAFPVLLMQMTQAGEVTGSMDKVMEEMSEHYEKEYKLTNKISSSLAYPILLIGMTVLVVIFLFVFVLPRFFSMFENAELPTITKVMMAISGFMTQYWPAAILIVMLSVALWSLLMRTKGFRLFVDTAKIKLPVIGKANMTIYTSRFCSSMSILYGSGISMIQSIEISVSVLNNSRLAKLFETVAGDVRMGDMLSLSMERLGVFDGMVSSMIYVGEESGSLDKTLRKLADYYEEESSTALQRMVSLLEPCMMIFIAIIIGLVVASVMLPMYSMYASII